MQDYVILTACDKSRWEYALNLVGSLQRKSPGYKAIYVYDLGLTWYQKLQFRGIKGVELKKVPPFTKFWRQGWSWKPWIWLNAGAKKAIFLDAGTEALRDLSEICTLIERDGYFLVSQNETLEGGVPLSRITPPEYFEHFGVNARHKNKPVVAAGILGYKASSPFITKVVPQVYAAVLEGYNLGWSANETWRNVGINKLPNPTIRDCEYFRHDQTLLNLFLYKEIPKPVIQEITKFGGFRSPHDHPEQLIWNSRANTTLSNFANVDYGGLSALRNGANKLYYRWRKSAIGLLTDRAFDKLKRIMGRIY